MSSLFAMPELGSDTLTARGYQLEVLEAVRNEFKARIWSTMVVLPTGTGKTVAFSKISRATVEKGGKVLILAHRGELIDQAANTLERVGIIAGIEKADSHARAICEPDVVVGTVQTFQGKRLASWDPNYFKLLIVDECHHATADTYGNVIRHFSGARVLGVTATPDRADKSKLTQVFETVAYEMSIWDAMTAPDPGPFLCRLKFVQCDVGIDLRNIRTTAGDLNQADLEEAIRPYIDTLANSIRQEVGSRSTLCFTPDVGSAMAMATALQSIGMSADWISGDSADRAEKLSRYKDGRIQVLCNCALLTEGFDAPRTSAIALCRPTKSRSLFSQMIGRGTRLYPGKENCLVIDFGFLTAKHDLVRPADLFDDTVKDKEVLDIADKIMRETPGKDLLDAIEQAREDKEEKEKRRQLIKIDANEREVKYRRVAYDPLHAANVLGIKFKGATEARLDPPSRDLIEKARQKGIRNPETMSHRYLTKLLQANTNRTRKGFATLKQIQCMMAEGFDAKTAREMTIQQASDTIGQFPRFKEKVAV